MKRKAIRIFLFIIGIILGLLTLYQLYLNFRPEIRLLMHFDSHNEQLLIQMVRNHGIEDLAFLFVLNVICVAVPGLSNGIFSVLNGILYGPKIGFLINWIGDILGQLILITLLQKLYSPEKLEHSKIYKILMSLSFPQVGLSIAYILPFIPSATVAYANDLINKTFTKRLIPIAVGTIPFAYLYAYGGDSLLHFDSSRIIKTVIGIVAIALVAIIILFILKKIEKRQA